VQSDQISDLLVVGQQKIDKRMLVGDHSTASEWMAGVTERDRREKQTVVIC